MSLYRVAPNALWGWSPDLIVEIESKPVDAAKRVFQILLDREPIGFVMKRSATEWDYLLGTVPPTAAQMLAVYSSPSRLAAITSLVEAHQKGS